MDQDEKELKNVYMEIERKRSIKQANCQHQFIRDLIDIDPDRSMTIVYCELCEKIQKDA
jgi:hypothetical protein